MEINKPTVALVFDHEELPSVITFLRELLTKHCFDDNALVDINLLTTEEQEELIAFVQIQRELKSVQKRAYIAFNTAPNPSVGLCTFKHIAQQALDYWNQSEAVVVIDALKAKALLC